MYDSTITLFNLREAEDVRRWFPTVFHGVTLTEIRGNAAAPNAGIISADTVEVILPASADRSVSDGSGAAVRYALPKEYAALPDPSGRFTFTPQQDFFVVGDLSGTYPEPVEDEAEDGFHGFYHAINKARDGVYLVTAAAFFPLIPHFEIGGK